jgi:Rieske 2Fe-2S family protein
MKETGGIRRLEPTLAGRYYCDPLVLDREWERIFYRSWLCVGREERLARPGDYFLATVGNESVLVVRDRDQRLRAFYNVCRHRGARLCAAEEGHLKGAVQCVYHAWTYALDGRLIGTPNLSETDEISRADFGLHPVAIDSWAGFVFINLAGDRAPSLASELGPIPDRIRRYPLATLRSDRRVVHEVDANWKILMENYQECYHCPGVHPELCDLVPLYRKGVVDAVDKETAYFREGAVTFTSTGTTRRPLLTGLDEEERRKYYGEAIFPNLMLNLFPDYAQTRIVWPLSPSRSRIITEWLFEPSTMARDDFDSSDAIEFITLVSRQDWDVCEAVQQGMGSRGFQQGIYTSQEVEVLEFTRWFTARFEAP